MQLRLECTMALLPSSLDMRETTSQYIVLGLASQSLVSVIKLCNAGCQVDIRDISCEIRYRGEIIVRCSKDTDTVLWVIPLTSRIEEPT